MALRLNILATAAIMLPVAASAQSAQDQQPTQPPAAGTAAQPADANAQADAKAQDDVGGAAKPATKADVKVGATVYDPKGGEVGKIDSVDAKGATLNTGKVKVTIPLKGFAVNAKGLVLGMTKAEVEAAAAKDQ